MEDFKVGIEHFTRWERMAVVTDVDWIKHTMQFFSFMMPGEMKIFPPSEAAQARAWVAAQMIADRTSRRARSFQPRRQLCG